MRRRRLIVMLGGAAAAWPSAGFAQGAGRPRRIAVLMGVKGDDTEGQGRLDALRAGLQERGWVDGETAKLEVYWAGGEIARIRALVIPPAWKDVWICTNERGHIQAVGKDARGRTQYRYHAKWRKVRDESKYEKMIAFGRSLPSRSPVPAATTITQVSSILIREVW